MCYDGVQKNDMILVKSCSVENNSVGRDAERF